MRETPKQLWVLRDLSNGNGAEGHERPTYVWTLPTRHAARKKRWAHQRDATKSTLGPVERWKSMRGYVKVQIIVEQDDCAYYWHRIRTPDRKQDTT